VDLGVNPLPAREEVRLWTSLGHSRRGRGPVWGIPEGAGGVNGPHRTHPFDPTRRTHGTQEVPINPVSALLGATSAKARWCNWIHDPLRAMDGSNIPLL
jgi:hypothetical protein